MFYDVALALLKFYQEDLLKMKDAGQIVGQIKQARLGCEHLLMLSSQQSIHSSRRHTSIQKSAQRFSEGKVTRKSDVSIPFSILKMNHELPEPFGVDET